MMNRARAAAAYLSHIGLDPMVNQHTTNYRLSRIKRNINSEHRQVQCRVVNGNTQTPIRRLFTK